MHRGLGLSRSKDINLAKNIGRAGVRASAHSQRPCWDEDERGLDDGLGSDFGDELCL